MVGAGVTDWKIDIGVVVEAADWRIDIGVLEATLATAAGRGATAAGKRDIRVVEAGDWKIDIGATAAGGGDTAGGVEDARADIGGRIKKPVTVISSVIAHQEKIF